MRHDCKEMLLSVLSHILIREGDDANRTREIFAFESTLDNQDNAHRKVEVS
jgi:hypothetical protein